MLVPAEPEIRLEILDLIRKMSHANPPLGALLRPFRHQGEACKHSGS